MRRNGLSDVHGKIREISTKYDERNFSIIFANIGDFRNRDIIRDFYIRMGNRADIARIQETRNTNDSELKMEYYNIYIFPWVL